jgi:DNA repair protein RadC
MEQPEIQLQDFVTSAELSEVIVSYKSKQKLKVKICKSRDAYEVFSALYDKDIIEYQEQFYLLLLNRANLVLGWIKLSQGGTSGTFVDPKIIFTLALKTNASSIVLCHNHPSGNITPSESDISLTKKVNMAGQVLDVKLLDHLIISNDEAYYSFADEGLL